MLDFAPYAEFFADEWQALLDDVNAHWSWDRKACYLYLNATQGNTTMARKPGRKPAQNTTVGALNGAIAFLSAVPQKAADPNYLVINGNMLYVSNGIIKAGIIVGEALPADAVAKVLLDPFAGALASVGKEVEIAFTDENMTFTSGSFVGVLEQFPILIDIDRAAPDESIAPLNDEFREAVKKVMRLVSDTSEELLTATIALTGDSVMATRRTTLLQAWHGNNMPPAGMIYVPKAFGQALAKTKDKITSFGFGLTTFTVYFENQRFLQTNTIPNAWNVDGKEQGFAHEVANRLLDGNVETHYELDPVEFRKHMAALYAISQADVHATLGQVATVDGAALLAAKEVQCEFVIHAGWWDSIADLPTVIHVARDSTPSRMLFWGDKVRGAVVIDAELLLLDLPGKLPAGTPAASGGWTPPPNPTQGAPAGADAGWGTALSLPADTTQGNGAQPPLSSGQTATSDASLSKTFDFPRSTAEW